MKTISIKESDIKNAISSVLNEAVFGLTGADVERMGFRNPAENYVIDYTEVAQKCEQMRESLQEFKRYIQGVEEDAENGVEAQDGVAITASMRSNWSEEPDDEELAEILDEISANLTKIESSLSEATSLAQHMAQWEARMRSRR